MPQRLLKYRPASCVTSSVQLTVLILLWFAASVSRCFQELGVQLVLPPQASPSATLGNNGTRTLQAERQSRRGEVLLSRTRQAAADAAAMANAAAHHQYYERGADDTNRAIAASLTMIRFVVESNSLCTFLITRPVTRVYVYVQLYVRVQPNVSVISHTCP